MHTIKLLLTYYLNISVQAANLSECRIESNRIETFFARIGMLYCIQPADYARHCLTETADVASTSSKCCLRRPRARENVRFFASFYAIGPFPANNSSSFIAGLMGLFESGIYEKCNFVAAQNCMATNNEHNCKLLSLFVCKKHVAIISKLSLFGTW